MKIRLLQDCHTTLAFLLFIQNTFMCTSIVLSRHRMKMIGLNLRVVFSLLCTIKDNLGLESPCKYSIPWECGNVYIGQTCCFIKTTVSEHCHICTNWESSSWWSMVLTLTYSVTGILAENTCAWTGSQGKHQSSMCTLATCILVGCFLPEHTFPFPEREKAAGNSKNESLTHQRQHCSL